MADSDRIARLRITLDDVAPVILRRIEAPVGVRLDDLHLYFQIAMGWENCHLYEFRTRGDRWGLVDPDFAELDVISAKEATLAELLKRGGAKTFKYVYDFGDGWEHTVKVEALDQPATSAGYPRLLEARRRCPPEDVGGPWGYARYLKALADPDHERHDEFVEWRGPGFDPALVDEAAIRKAFDRLAKKASPRASKAAAKRRH